MIAVFLGVAPAALAEDTGLEKQRRSLGILNQPLHDASAFYMFRSYETGRENFVTLIANYNPGQDPVGLPLLYPLDETAFYTIHIDNDSDGMEDISFRFKFNLTLNRNVPTIEGLAVPVPLVPPGTGIPVPIGITQTFPVGPGTPPGGAPPLPPPRDQRLNFLRTYTIRVLNGQTSFLTNVDNGSNRFAMPADYASVRQFPQYENYVRPFTHDVRIPGCATPGRVFVGQRKMSHTFNLGEFFALVGVPDFTGNRAARSSSFANKNVTSLALEVPIDCLLEDGMSPNPVIAGWTTVDVPRTRVTSSEPTFDELSMDSNNFVQVFRLGNPFVNEASIGMKDKNLYDRSHPTENMDVFDIYFTHPTIPVGLQLVRGLQPPTVPRTDLVAFYLTGLTSLNETAPGYELLRLNTSISPVAAAAQNNLGAIDGDRAGWPNGRRPGDDVIDIAIRVLEGALCHVPIFAACVVPDVTAPDGMMEFTDQAWVDALMFDEVFPYLKTPIPGSTVVLDPMTVELIFEPNRIFTAELFAPANPLANSVGGTCTAIFRDAGAAGGSGIFSCAFNSFVFDAGSIRVTTDSGTTRTVPDCGIANSAGALTSFVCGITRQDLDLIYKGRATVVWTTTTSLTLEAALR